MDGLWDKSSSINYGGSATKIGVKPLSVRAFLESRILLICLDFLIPSLRATAYLSPKNLLSALMLERLPFLLTIPCIQGATLNF